MPALGEASAWLIVRLGASRRAFEPSGWAAMSPRRSSPLSLWRSLSHRAPARGSSASASSMANRPSLDVPSSSTHPASAHMKSGASPEPSGPLSGQSPSRICATPGGAVARPALGSSQRRSWSRQQGELSARREIDKAPRQRPAAPVAADRACRAHAQVRADGERRACAICSASAIALALDANASANRPSSQRIQAEKRVRTRRDGDAGPNRAASVPLADCQGRFRCSTCRSACGTRRARTRSPR